MSSTKRTKSVILMAFFTVVLLLTLKALLLDDHSRNIKRKAPGVKNANNHRESKRDLARATQLKGQTTAATIFDLKSLKYPRVFSRKHPNGLEDYWVIGQLSEWTGSVAHIRAGELIFDRNFVQQANRFNGIAIMSSSTAPTFYKPEAFFGKSKIQVNDLGGFVARIVFADKGVENVEVKVTPSSFDCAAFQQLQQFTATSAANDHTVFPQELVDQILSFASERTAKTDLAGMVRIKNCFVPAKIRVSIVEKDFTPISSKLQLSAKRPIHYDRIELQRASYVRGQLFGVKKPVDKGRVEVRQVFEKKDTVRVKTLFRVPCGPNGEFEFDTLAPGRYQFLFSGSSSEVRGRFYVSEEIDLGTSGADLGRIKCFANKVSGIVVDEVGKPVPGVVLSVTGNRDYMPVLMSERLVSDKNGRFNLYIARGKSIVIALKRDEMPREKALTPNFQIGRGNTPLRPFIYGEKSVPRGKFKFARNRRVVSVVLWSPALKRVLTADVLRKVAGGRISQFDIMFDDRESPQTIWMYGLDSHNRINASLKLDRDELDAKQLVEITGVDFSITKKIKVTVIGDAKKYPILFSASLAEAPIAANMVRESFEQWVPLGAELRAYARGRFINGQKGFSFHSDDSGVVLNLTPKKKGKSRANPDLSPK